MKKRTENRNKTMDKLEKYIQTHRDQFDSQNPDPAIWNKISERLPAPVSGEMRRIVLWKRVSIAAAIVALVMSGIVAGMYMGRQRMSQNPAYAEFTQAQQYYTVEFNKKKSELSQYTYDPEVDRDLKELDKLYQDLSKEFQTTTEPDKTELINAMIQVYKSRIELLSRVLNRIEQSKNEIQLNNHDENVKI